MSVLLFDSRVLSLMLKVFPCVDDDDGIYPHAEDGHQEVHQPQAQAANKLNGLAMIESLFKLVLH